MSRALDALFAAKVLGCKVRVGPEPCPDCDATGIQPKDTHYTHAPRRLDENGNPIFRQYWVKAGEPCGQCKGTKVVHWYGPDEPRCRCEDHRDHSDDRGDLLAFTESLDAAWQGVERLAEAHKTFRLQGFSGGQCDMQLGLRWHADKSSLGFMPDVQGGPAPTPALAIVLACLRASGVSEEEIQAACAP